MKIERPMYMQQLIDSRDNGLINSCNLASGMRGLDDYYEGY